MNIRSLVLGLIFAASVGILHADYNKFYFTDCGSQGIDIKQLDVTPMPIFHPGPVSLTFVADVKRPISQCETKNVARR